MLGSLTFWVVFHLFIFLLLAIDLGLFNRQAHTVSVRESLIKVSIYTLISLAFAGLVFYEKGMASGYEFITAYLVEQSLSIDNLFVFILIFQSFKVPQIYQARVLFWGVVGAMVFRAIIIYAGVQLVERFEWILILFGVFLIYTGVKLFFKGSEEDEHKDVSKHKIVLWMSRHFSITKEYDKAKFFVRKNGKLWMTPLFLVLLVIEVMDVVFAADSIPAVFSISRDPMVLYTSNVFAILGLRSLYFALAAMMHMFKYLPYGISFVLAWIGVKMVLNEVLGHEIINNQVGLLVTVLALVGSIGLSLILEKRSNKMAN